MPRSQGASHKFWAVRCVAVWNFSIYRIAVLSNLKTMGNTGFFRAWKEALENFSGQFAETAETLDFFRTSEEAQVIGGDWLRTDLWSRWSPKRDLCIWVHDMRFFRITVSSDIPLFNGCGRFSWKRRSFGEVLREGDSSGVLNYILPPLISSAWIDSLIFPMKNREKNQMLMVE